MPEKILTLKIDGPLAYLTLNRPEQGNVLSWQLAWELEAGCSKINQSDEVRAVILAGAGESFCLGEDLGTYLDAVEHTPLLEGGSPANIASRAVAGLLAPSIAALVGDALGGGLELALSCDLRVASEESRFGLPQTAYGLIPSGGGTQRLPRLVGRGKALEMLLLAEPISAQEAYRIGLVYSVVPRDQVLACCEELAQSIVSRSPFAERYAKEAILKGMDMTLEQGLRLEEDLSLILQTTSDRAEGISAFLEKRTPRFEGK